VAFRDFPVEYPPLAWWVMQLPGTSDRLAYYFRFRALMCAADVTAFALLAWIVFRRRESMLATFTVLYGAATVILGHELYDRLDMGVLFFVAVAMAAWVASFERQRKAPWLAGAYLAVGIGTAYKLFPAILAPFFAISEVVTRTRWRSVGLRLMLCVVVASFPLALTYAYAGNGAFGFFSYHGTRGLEIESTWASVLWVLSFVRYPAVVVIRHGSWELAGAAEQVVLEAAGLSTVVWLGGLVVWAVVLGRRFDGARAYLQAVLALGGLVIVSKAFSPQYLIWAIPVLALAAVEVVATKRQFYLVTALLLVCATLTALAYPVGRREIGSMNTWIMLALLARNVVYVSLWLWLLGVCLRKDLAADRSQ